jgi:hypothetical protein
MEQNGRMFLTQRLQKDVKLATRGQNSSYCTASRKSGDEKVAAVKASLGEDRKRRC